MAIIVGKTISYKIASVRKEGKSLLFYLPVSLGRLFLQLYGPVLQISFRTMLNAQDDWPS